MSLFKVSVIQLDNEEGSKMVFSSVFYLLQWIMAA